PVPSRPRRSKRCTMRQSRPPASERRRSRPTRGGVTFRRRRRLRGWVDADDVVGDYPAGCSLGGRRRAGGKGGLMRGPVLLSTPSVAWGHVPPITAGLSPVDPRVAPARGLTARITGPVLLAGLLTLVVAALTPTPALAAQKGWLGGDGNWMDGAHWT